MQIHFEHAHYIYLVFLLLPLIGTWFWWHKKKKEIVKSLADSPLLLQTFIKNSPPAKGWLKPIFFSLSFFMLVLALMNPQMPEPNEWPQSKGIQLIIAIDVSKSMLANDVSPNRLEKARNLSIELLESLNNVKIGLIAFAGEVVLQMPPTSDVSALRQAIETLSIETVPEQGTNLEQVLHLAYNSLSTDALSKKAVWIITDGEELEGEARKAALELSQKGLLIHVAGVGTEEGIQVPNPTGGGILSDESGEPVISKMNAGLLQDIANVSGGDFFPLSDLKESKSFWTNAFQKLEKVNLPNEDLLNFKSLSPILLSLGLFLLLWPGFFHLFNGLQKRKPAILFFFLLLSGLPSQAQDRNEWIKKANQLYKEGNFKEALEKFQVANLDNPKDERTMIYLGLVNYHLRNFQQSADWFTQVHAILSDEGLKKTVAFNAGLALANSDKLPEAIEYFKDLQTKYPDDRDVLRNLQKALMEQKKKEQKKENKEEQKPPMNKEDASQKLQSVMEEERRVRENIKPKPTGGSRAKNW